MSVHGYYSAKQHKDNLIIYEYEMAMERKYCFLKYHLIRGLVNN